MNHLDSDLEEGEIIDSPPLSPKLNSNKEKKLPQRYVVKDNKSPIHKHKRGCRHAVRHHAKKLTKLKKTPVRKKNITKLYHKPSCSYEKSHRDFDKHDISDTFKHVLPKNGSFSHNSLIAEMKGSLKNVPSLKKLSTNLDKSRSQRVPFRQKNVKTSENNIAISEISNARLLKNGVDKSVTNNVGKKIEYLPERQNSSNSLIDLSKSPDDEAPEIEIIIPEVVVPPLIDLTNLEDEPINNHLNSNHVENVNAISNNSSQVKEEESEDEEELRRIALATCAKRKALKESETTIQNTENPCSVSVPDISNANVQIFHKVTNNEAADNYEVIDMEVDEDTQITTEIIETNQKSETSQELFIIDKNPSNEFLQNKTNEFPEAPIADNSDEDFEVNILRAELITNMFRKKLIQDDKEQLNIAKHKKLVQVMQQKKHLTNYQKSNLQFSYKRLKSAKHFLRKRSVNKLVSTNNTNKTPLPVLSKPSERLIITVNGESSDDSDEEANKDPENPVDSIVALISDCRHKSECTSEVKEKEIVPQALSCLSKAQQEEYNSLMKILEKKKKVPEKAVSAKNAHFKLDDLKKLETKLVVLTGAQKKKKQSMAVLSEEVTSKKLCYMKAKLTTQHLKEQLVAAEKVRKAKLLEWSKTCDNLKLMKQSVSDLEKKINEVQNLCSKIGSSLQGQSYKLPLLPSSNEQS